MKGGMHGTLIRTQNFAGVLRYFTPAPAHKLIGLIRQCTDLTGRYKVEGHLGYIHYHAFDAYPGTIQKYAVAAFEIARN